MGVTTWTDAQDEMLLMCLKADHSYMQIAETLGVSKAMVSGRLYRLRKLRPHDVPEKHEISLITKIGSKPANKLGEVSTPKLDWKPTSIVIEKLANQPKPFVQLEHGLAHGV